MKRRFKALYLVIILGLLWIGLGVAAYYLMISPQMLKNKKAQDDWTSSKTAMESAVTTAKASADSYPVSAGKLLDGYRVFHAIQNTMPRVYNMKETYAGRDREGLRDLYLTMGTGRLSRELSTWTSKYHLSNTPRYLFTGTLGYEDTLTSVKMVSVDFGEQTFIAYGYADLIRQIQNRYGYAHFPLIIAGLGGSAGAASTPGAAVQGAPEAPGAPGMPPPSTPGMASPSPTPQRMQSAGITPAAASAPDPTAAGGAAPAPSGDPAAGGATAAPAAASGGSFTITVDRHNRRHTPGKPALVMKYTAAGAFLTRGWDPNGATIKNDLANAKQWMTAPPPFPAEPSATDFPLIFGFLGKLEDAK